MMVSTYGFFCSKHILMLDFKILNVSQQSNIITVSEEVTAPDDISGVPVRNTEDVDTV